MRMIPRDEVTRTVKQIVRKCHYAVRAYAASFQAHRSNSLAKSKSVKQFLLTPSRLRANISVTDVLMNKPPSPQELLPLTPSVFHILVALSDEERHGYGIMQDVARQTNDALQLGPGTLYGCLKRMLAAGMVEESDARPDPALDDERRRYYRMTPLGRRVVRAEAHRLADAVTAAKSRRLFDRPAAGVSGGE
jgi:DNA-binding PadR family transcriptional regulator